jgi:deazaflavin-dependent oxidoreductase (nitroreductase family)
MARMGKKQYSLLHRLNQRFGASAAGSWIYSRTLHRLDRGWLKVSGGRMTLTSLLAGLPVAILTTTGAKSGEKRTYPLLFVRDEADANKLAVVASNYGKPNNPSWYYNMKANPRVTCDIRGEVGEYIAREAEGEEYDAFWQSAVDMYIGYPGYKRRASNRHIPIMVLTPADS